MTASTVAPCSPPRLPHPFRLSPSQKSYRDNPSGFLERLQARAESLAQDGYTAYPANAPHAFVVAPDRPKGGEVAGYLVHPLCGTCSCPFYARQLQGEYLGEDETLVPCKHLTGLPALIRATCRRHANEGDIHACCRLWQHWMITQSKKRRLRLEREKAEALQQLKQARQVHGHASVSGKVQVDEVNRR